MKRFFLPWSVLWLAWEANAYALSFARVFVPADVKERFVACPMQEKPDTGTLMGKTWKWRTANEINFQTPQWPKALSDGLEALKLDKDIYATVIDLRKLAGNKHGFVYLSNGTYDQKIQPWSSAKWLAAASALRMMRAAGVGANSQVNGGPLFGDIFSTAMHGFATPKVKAGSNEYGTWFQNIAGRRNSNELVRQWLQRPNESFGGGYGKLYATSANFRDLDSGKVASVYNGDANGTPTRLSTLTLAEAMRRLVAQGDSDNPTAWPGLTQSDIETLLYGSPKELGGLLVGIDGYLRQALGGKKKLDASTDGRWRVFGKMGAAELYVGNEQIVNAYVCLPKVDGGRAVILSVHAFGLVGKAGDRRLQEAVDKIMRAVVPSYFD